MLAAPLVMGQELADALWQDDVAALANPWRCPGRYTSPPMPFPLELESASLPLVATAQSYSSLDSRVDATGGVVIRQGNRLLAAGSATFDDATSLARATGNVRFDEPGFSVLGTRATVDFGASHARVDEAEFVLTDRQLRGQADTLERRDDVLELDSATVTSCPPGGATWQIRARSVRLDTDSNVATSRHARLVLGRVPVFYAPYLRFPVSGRRTSGFLVPDFYRGRDGFDLSVPYYFNLASNYDATLTPRWIAERGLGLEGEVRHRTRTANTRLDASFLREDRQYDGEFGRADSRSAGAFSPSDRWALGVDHRGRRGSLRTEIDYAAVSDNDYFVDFAVEQGLASRVALERRGEIEYARGGFVGRLLAQRFQRLESGRESYQRLPAVGVSYAGPLIGPLGWSMGATGVWFDSPTGTSVTGRRYHVDPRLQLTLNRPWGFLKMSGGMRGTRYDLSGVSQGVDPRPRRTLGVGALDAGLVFERDVSLASGPATQTLEPRLYYLRQSHADQEHLPVFDAAELTFSYRQLFRDNRYAGLDRIEDADRVSLGVVSRLFNAMGSEVMTARLGTMVHLDEPRVMLGGPRQMDPEVVGELSGRLGRVRVISRLAWDVGGDELGELGTGLSYRRDARRMVNLAYRRRFPDVDQTDLSFHWPIPGMGERVSAFARWNHDWRHGQNIESFAGFAYANCCLAVKLLWHRTIDAPRNLPEGVRGSHDGLMVQVSLKGLGGFGSKVDSRLVRGIKGYRPGGT
ncbi:MAG: LPS-assembly protein LptD [Gammaproteobacteria bacterium]|nr:LPS-assembly protein LptD [Gammaproteobacteria bacterium]